MTRFIDLSIPITNDVISDPEVMRPKVTYMTHENTWEQIAMFFRHAYGRAVALPFDNR